MRRNAVIVWQQTKTLRIAVLGVFNLNFLIKFVIQVSCNTKMHML